MVKKPEKEKKESISNANGVNTGDAGKIGPTLNILTQYIKDMSFENPHAPDSLRPRDKAPDIKINVNVGANSLSETDFEVELKLEARAEDEKKVMFNTELVYAGIFRIQGIAKESIGPAVLIECPRLLFPFARQIVADSTRNGGFPPLMIDPIDFAQLYQAQMAKETSKDDT